MDFDYYYYLRISDVLSRLLRQYLQRECDARIFDVNKFKTFRQYSARRRRFARSTQTDRSIVHKGQITARNASYSNYFSIRVSPCSVSLWETAGEKADAHRSSLEQRRTEVNGERKLGRKGENVRYQLYTHTYTITNVHPNTFLLASLPSHSIPH